MKNVMTAVVLSLALAGAAGCGGDDGGSESSSKEPGGKYPEQVRKTFLDSCDSQPNATRKTCECALDKVEKTVSFDEFKKADEAIREDPNAKPPGYDKLIKAARECAKS